MHFDLRTPICERTLHGGIVLPSPLDTGGSPDCRAAGAFYACSSYYRRGKTVCPNRLESRYQCRRRPVKALQDELLTETFMGTVVRKVIARRIPTGHVLEKTRARLRAQLAEVQGELDTEAPTIN
jgi:hypothetical protein